MKFSSPLLSRIIVVTVLSTLGLFTNPLQANSSFGKPIKAGKIFERKTEMWNVSKTISGCYLQVEAAQMKADYYEGEPFKKGIDGFLWMNYGQELFWNGGQLVNLPAAARIQLSAELMNVMRSADNLFDILVFVGNLDEVMANIMRPYYFKKSEVTNFEYREFIYWVEAQNKTKNTDAHEYTFNDANNIAVQKLGSAKLNIYPDTTVWTKDFMYSFNEPMNNYYAWHPAYDNYPVVGVSWYQAMAYLDWMQKQTSDGVFEGPDNLKLTYSLPSDLEWELVLRSQGTAEKHSVSRDFNADVTWITDLMIHHNEGSEFRITNPLLETISPRPSPGNFVVVDGHFHTCQADQGKGKMKGNHGNKIYLSSVGVSCMGGNVSEWMEDSFEAYDAVFKKHQQLLKKQEGTAYQLMIELENYFHQNNDANGQLVRGSNWYDQRFADEKPAAGNRNGATQKAYLSPDRQHSTVGFRYVIRAELEVTAAQ